jgi:asparagine synthase (glutamine-hydrolysing)
MFGVAGIWDFNKFITQENLDNLRDYLNYSGVEGYGSFLNKEKDLGLICKEVSDGEGRVKHQIIKKDEHIIVFNGELRNRESLGSGSDAEIILDSFIKEGKSVFKKFEGTFVFSIFNEKTEKLVIARSKTKAKPLYYFFDEKVFLFSSELRAVIKYTEAKDIDLNSLSLFLKLGYVPAPYTVLKNIFKLESGCCLEIDRSKEIEITRYWNIFDIEKEKYLLCEEFEKIIDEKLKKACVSKKPSLVLLNNEGSILTSSYLKQNKVPQESMSVSFNGSGNEKYGAIFSRIFKVENNNIDYSQEDVRGAINGLYEVFDEPFGKTFPIMSSLIFSSIKDKVDNIFLDWGSEEMFYNNERCVKVFRKFSLMRIASFFGGFFKSNLRLTKLSGYSDDFKRFYLTDSSFFLDEELKDGMLKEFDDSEYLKKTILFNSKTLDKENVFNQIQLIDSRNYIENVSLVLNKASVFNKVELRMPFCNDDIVELSRKVPVNCKKKNLLSDVLSEYVSPQILDTKKNIKVPLDQFLRTDKEIFNYLELGVDIFKEEFLNEEKEKFLKGKTTYHRIWNILSFLMWRDKWLLK